MNAFRFRCCTTLVAAVLLAVTILSPTYAQTQAINWTGYSQMPNTGTTPSSPSSVYYQGQLYIFTRGFDNAIHYNVLGSSWSSYLTVPNNGTTSSGPRCVVLNGLLYLFIRGYGDSKIYYTTFDGSSWTGYQQVPGNAQTRSEPTPVVQGSILLLLNHGLSDGKFFYTYTVNPTPYNWAGYAEIPPGGATSGSQLSAAPYTEGGVNQIFAFFRGPGNGVYYNTYSFNNSGNVASFAWNNYYSQVPGNVTTDSGLAPVAYNGGGPSPTYNDLFVFSKGVGTGQVNYSILNEATNSWTGPFQIPYSNSTVSTSIAPNAVNYNNYIFVFQRGSDNKIYFTQGYF